MNVFLDIIAGDYQVFLSSLLGLSFSGDPGCLPWHLKDKV